MSDLPYAPMRPRAEGGLAASEPRRVAGGVMFSVTLHVLFAVLMAYAAQRPLPMPAKQSIRAVLISPTVQQGAKTTDVSTAATTAPPTPATTPSTATAPTVRRTPETPAVPVKKTAKAVPPAKPKPSDPETRPSPASSKAKPATSPVPVDSAGDDEESDSLLSQLRGNWLPPPRSSPLFRCRLRISYRDGGNVTGVDIQQGCTDRVLADSIERAVWKTQPLQLPSGSPATGSIDVEFSP